MHGTILGNCCLSLIFVIENSVKKPAQCVRVHLKWIAVFWLLYSSCTRLWKISTNLTHLSQRWRIFFCPECAPDQFYFSACTIMAHNFSHFAFSPRPVCNVEKRQPMAAQYHQAGLATSVIWLCLLFVNKKNRWFASRANQWSLHGENICSHLLLEGAI